MHNVDPFITKTNTAIGSDKHTGLYSYAWLNAHSQELSSIEGTKSVPYPESAMRPPR